jgi:hypothetical protein
MNGYLGVKNAACKFFVFKYLAFQGGDLLPLLVL